MKFFVPQFWLTIWALVCCLPALGGAQNPFQVVALVDQTPITTFEINSRVRLLQAVSGAQTVSPELPGQVLESLVDEAIQLNIARAQGIAPGSEDLDAAFTNIAANNNLSDDEFADALTQRGIEVDAFKARLLAQITWNTLLTANVSASAQVSDAALDEEWARIQAHRGTTERLLTEVYLQGASQEEAEQVAADMRESGDFSSFARANSDSPSAANNGDIGWVRAGTLGPARNAALQDLRVGDISAPAAASGGQFIYAVRGVRPIGTSSATELFDLRRLFITLENEGNSVNDGNKLLTLDNVLKRVDSCERFDQAVELYGEGASGPVGQVSLAQLPPVVRNAVNDLETNQISPLLPERGGAAVYINCGIEIQTEPLTREQVRTRLFNENVQTLGEDLMIELRRQAYIEYR